MLSLDVNSAVHLHHLTATNPCNPAYVACTDVEHQSTESITLKSQHNWGHVFKAGVSYTAGASASFEGLGVNESITMSVEESWSTGGFKETDQTISSTQKCTAKPMTIVDCQYIAYKGSIEIGYTIYWKNSSPTRGVYKGVGWKSVLETRTTAL